MLSNIAGLILFFSSLKTTNLFLKEITILPLLEQLIKQGFLTMSLPSFLECVK